MTNDQVNDVPYTEPVSPYFQVGIPGVPYSAIRAPLGTSEESMKEWASWVATCAEIIAEAYADVFPSAPQDVPVRQVTIRAPGTHGTSTHDTSVGVPAVAASTGAFCPEHPNVEVVPSKQQYARFEMDENGNEVQANYFCPGEKNGTGKNHNVWRRQLVRAE